MSTSRTHRERGDLFGARFELFADVLAVGLAAAVTALPLVTFPAALSTACTLLRRRRLQDEPCTAGRYLAALRGRLARPGDWAAGAVMLAFSALVAADAGLATAGLPGAGPSALGLAVVAAGAVVVGLRACALHPCDAGTAVRPANAAGTAVPRTDAAPADGGHEPPGWGTAVRAGAHRAIADLPGSALVSLALGTTGVCAWSLPPVLLLLPGPLALALTVVELRWERAG